MKPTTQRGYLRPLFLGGLGVAALSLTLAMNYYFGASLAKDADAKLIQGAAAIVVDLIVVGMALVTGTFFREKKYAMGAVALTITALFSFYSVASNVGFSASQRMAQTMEAEQITRQNDATAEANAAAAIALRKETLDWMKKTALKVGRQERTRIYSSMNELTVSPIVNPDSKKAAPTFIDAQANAIVSLLSFAEIRTTVEQVQIAMAVALAVLLVFGKAICFSFASYFWPIRDQSPKEKIITRDNHDSPLPIYRGQNIITHNDNKNALNDDELTAAIKPDVDELADMQNQVERFLKECTEHAPGALVSAMAVYDCYCIWAVNNSEEHLTQNRFGRLCTAIGIERDSIHRRRAHYLDIRLKDNVARATFDQAA